MEQLLKIVEENARISLEDLAVMVGDNPRRDIAGAHAAGMRTLWIARGRTYEGAVPPDGFCDLPTDVPVCLEGMPC